MTDPGDSGVLDAVLDATSDGVAVVDADGRVAAVNDALVDLADADRDGVVGDDWRSLFVDPPTLDVLVDDPDDSAGVDESEPPIDGNEHAVDESERAADGDARGVDAMLANEAGERRLTIGTVEGTPASVSGSRAGDRVVLAVTDRTAAVERDRFERILESVDDGIYMLDADGRIEYVNQAALEAHDFSYDRSEVLGKFATAIMSADDVEACIDVIQSLIAADDATSEQVAVTVTDTDGTAVPAQLNLSLLPPEDGEYAGSVGVLRNVAERRRRDQMLRVLNRVLRHNLRNDMNVVLGMTQFVEAEHDGVEEYTSRIRRVASNLVELGGKANVVEELTGPNASAPEPADVVPIVEHAVDSVTDASTRDSVTVDAPASARASVPPLFEVAVENVVGNALEHDDDPRVRVAVAVDESSVRVAVTDDGPGIPSAELDALRANRETPLEHASGLGLWLTNWIVDSADGEVTYVVDDGTTVAIELPAAS
ncbi:PAS domain S-box protein [Halorubellus sp. JP-L1]|uniref:PAS domain-containing protein n=1 Tax=Halorubellus sp. JP-L1 TaxID=2715753 RepID=UPI001408B8F0|nr:PAS domain S-box protein [Halorubellus sp. JP-L1]NHN41152.1 PAS domain S-box protein [Halorubellus sp. JP-L1]